jgi:hypothetical protein
MSLYNAKKWILKAAYPEALTNPIFKTIEDHRAAMAGDPALQQWRAQCAAEHSRRQLPYSIATMVVVLVAWGFLGPWLAALFDPTTATFAALAHIVLMLFVCKAQH